MTKIQDMRSKDIIQFRDALCRFFDDRKKEIEISFVLVPILLKFSPAGGVQENNIYKIGKEKKKRGKTRQKDKGTKARTKDDKTKTQGEARQK